MLVVLLFQSEMHSKYILDECQIGYKTLLQFTKQGLTLRTDTILFLVIVMVILFSWAVFGLDMSL